SRAMPSSFSASASSSNSDAEVTAPVDLSMSASSVVRRARSLPSSCAFSGFCQMAGSSSSRVTSSSRSFFWSYSKKPPQGVHALLQVFELTLQLAEFEGQGRVRLFVWIGGPRILPERALHEYRQRIGLVRWKRRNFLESRA